MKLFVSVVLSSCIAASVVWGDTLEYTFTGTIPAGGSQHPNVSDLETFIASFLVDDATPDTDTGNPQNGLYFSAASAGQLTFSGGYVSPIDLSRSNMFVADNGPAPPTTSTIDAVQLTTDGLLIQAATFGMPNTLTSDDLPGIGFVLESSASMPVPVFQFQYADAAGQIGYDGMTELNVVLRVTEPGAVTGDFDGNGQYDCADIDALVAEISVSGSDSQFDLTGDGAVDTSDIEAWLAEAGEINLGAGKSYQYGDANLDGVVEVADFNVWNGNKFTMTTGWCEGDFTADGSVDVSDFNAWNENKFTSADAAAVPEPQALMLLVLGFGTMILRFR
ncbi:MAG: hypothetical protein AAF497_00200 [Planctomycetota bacterium]